MSPDLLEVVSAHWRSQRRVAQTFLSIWALVFVFFLLPALSEIAKLSKAAPTYDEVTRATSDPTHDELTKRGPVVCQLNVRSGKERYDACVSDDRAGSMTNVAVLLGIPLIPLLGMVGYLLARLRAAESTELHRLLDAQRPDVVWAYAIDTPAAAPGADPGKAPYSVALGLKSGKLVRLTPAGMPKDAVMAILTRELPSAVIGDTSESRARFAESPATMRRG